MLHCPFLKARDLAFQALQMTRETRDPVPGVLVATLLGGQSSVDFDDDTDEDEEDFDASDEDDFDDEDYENGTVKWFNTKKGYGFIPEKMVKIFSFTSAISRAEAEEA